MELFKIVFLNFLVHHHHHHHDDQWSMTDHTFRKLPASSLRQQLHILRHWCLRWGKWAQLSETAWNYRFQWFYVIWSLNKQHHIYFKCMFPKQHHSGVSLQIVSKFRYPKIPTPAVFKIHLSIPFYWLIKNGTTLDCSYNPQYIG